MTYLIPIVAIVVFLLIFVVIPIFQIKREMKVLEQMDRGEGPIHYVSMNGKLYFNVKKHLQTEKGKKQIYLR